MKIIILVLMSLILVQSASAQSSVLCHRPIPPSHHSHLLIYWVDHGADEDWIVQRDGKRLWTHKALGIKIYDPQTGITALECPGELVLVDRSGTIKRHVGAFTAFDPRKLLLSNSVLVYDQGAVNLAMYDPRTEGASTFQWLREVRAVDAFDLRTMKPLWEMSEMDLGLPISFQKGRLSTLKILNMERCMIHPKIRPVAAIREINLRTRHEIRRAILSGTRKDADDLIGDVEFAENIEETHLNWTATGVHVYDLYDKDYTGKVLHSRHKRSRTAQNRQSRSAKGRRR